VSNAVDTLVPQAPSATARGVFYMLLASFFFALMAVCVKMLPRLPVPELIFFRALISASLCLWGLWRAGVAPFGNDRVFLLIRGLCGVISLMQGYWLLQQIPLAAATTLTHLSPIFTTLLGIWYVREKIRPVQLLFFALSFAGVLLIQGFDYRIGPLHLLVGITASLTMAFAYNSVRKLGGSEHPLVIIFYFPLVCLPVTGIWSALVWVTPQGGDWLWLLLLGLTTQAGQYCMTLSYQHAKISRVAIVNYTEVLFSIGFGMVLFDEHFNLMTYAGIALVLAGVVLSMLVKNRK
jgi:drug/metabolite transporter (DMT)-like permease